MQGYYKIERLAIFWKEISQSYSWKQVHKTQKNKCIKLKFNMESKLDIHNRQSKKGSLSIHNNTFVSMASIGKTLIGKK